MIKTVLITGSGGFTGRYMTQEMHTAGYRVTGTGTTAAIPDAHVASYFPADLSDLESLRSAVEKIQPDIVIHLAALAFVGHGNANDFYQVNLVGSRNLLQAIADSGKTPGMILMASSANVYGNASGGMLSEATACAPTNDYAVSKLSMEYMARLWMDRLPIVLTRPFNYTGAGQADNFLLPKIVSHFRRRADVIELGNLDVFRDFSDVRAVVSAYRRLIENGAAGRTVNVCSGEARSLREAIDLCGAITGHEIDIQINPAFVRTNEVRTLCGDATALRSLIGDWRTPPLEVTLRWMLEDGVASQMR